MYPPGDWETFLVGWVKVSPMIPDPSMGAWGCTGPWAPTDLIRSHRIFAMGVQGAFGFNPYE